MDDANDQAAINEAEWADPSNWSWGPYRSARDSRVWVPKPVRWQGWTPNFAHRAAWAHAALLLIGPLVLSGAMIAAVMAASDAGR